MISRTLSLAVLLNSCALLAQISPFTGREVLPPDSNGHYRMIISGHFHGSSGNRSGFPAATLLASLDTINALGANVLLSTGDLFLDPDKDIPRYRRSLFDRLDIPLFNAPGNHDVGPAYSEAFGEVPILLAIGPDRILLLDTERDNGSLDGQQLGMLRKAGEGLRGRLFIVTHRPIWAEDDPRYGPLFEGNTRSVLPGNYRREAWPILERIAGTNEVFWISGSMAGRAPASIFFQEHAPRITFIQSALRDEPRDALLIADVGPEGITWSDLSLTGSTLPPVKELDADWWTQRMGSTEPFRWRLLPYLIGQVLRSAAFWYGFVVALLLTWVLRRAFQRWI